VTSQEVDVLIVGAGLSGIGAAAHLGMRRPGTTYAILEAREASGGTWDLFRYPGIRSDSDMFTLGYAFRPWTESKAIADGPAILKYVRDTAAEYHVDEHIRYRHRVLRASWSSESARWSVEAERTDTGDVVEMRCRFLLMCAGYYSYSKAHVPDFAGVDEFRGRVVYPQFWPQDLDYAGKRVVVIGSGATAVTIVPAMAASAAHVVMLQRSPTYIVARPGEDSIANSLRKRLPAKLAYALTRWKNVAIQQYFYGVARRKPAAAKQRIVAMVREALGPDYDVATHFTPSYNPWDQRLCLVPDADLFASIRAGKASVVTDTIEAFTPAGIRLNSGRELEADVVVVATGLTLNFLGDVALSVDGTSIVPSELMIYKGAMLSGVPNLAMVFGYTNASWTLRADLTSEFVCRLLGYMERKGFAVATPRRDASVQEQPFLDFTSGYVRRALASLPRQGTKRPWRLYQNYTKDLATLRFSKIDDGVLDFSKRTVAERAGSAGAIGALAQRGM
jgi:cation diffusion facilitator CzcD-associated flavoprotein CzcO